MNKRTKQTILILVLTAAAYSILVFALPFRFCATFFIAYAAELVAIGSMIPIFKVAFENAKTLKSKVYGFPVARIGYIYLGVQTAVSLLLAILSTAIAVFPVLVSIVLCSLILIAAWVGCIAADIARDEVEKIEQQTAVNTAFIKQMRVQSKGLAAKTEDAALKAELEKVAEKFRFSDPVSCEHTAVYDSKIDEAFQELERSVAGGDASALSQCKSLMDLIEERNTVCKAFKGR